MKDANTFKQYTWLINTIKNARRINFQRIQKLWIEDDVNNQKELSRTTFHRLKEAVEEMFGIRIECDNTNGYQYYIANPEALKDHSTQNWMLQTLTVNNILIDSLAIKDRLVLEEVPSGMEYLPIIIKALKNNKVLRMGYKKFSDTDDYVTLIQPYCLKMFRQRWYLLGRSEKKNNKLVIYALDRITQLETTSQSFELDPDFDADTFLKDIFGVFLDQDKRPTRIVLRAYGKMIPLLRTLPKHHSQKEIATEKDHSDFEYHLAPSFDFRQEILKEGHELEVIEPLSLRKMIREELLKTMELYQ